eukprot:scaffold39859_cov23-Cyclotella_meneghiniana.AAC.1
MSNSDTLTTDGRRAGESVKHGEPIKTDNHVANSGDDDMDETSVESVTGTSSKARAKRVRDGESDSESEDTSVKKGR